MLPTAHSEVEFDEIIVTSILNGLYILKNRSKFSPKSCVERANKAIIICLASSFLSDRKFKAALPSAHHFLWNKEQQRL